MFTQKPEVPGSITKLHLQTTVMDLIDWEKKKRNRITVMDVGKWLYESEKSMVL